jgi:5-methylcytosine-specific restriction endonuclease McrA
VARLKNIPSRLSSAPSRVGYASGDERARDKHRDASQHWRAWYRSARWRRLRLQCFDRDAYTCQRTGVICSGRGNEPLAPVANHRVPHRGDPALFWDLANLETVTKEAHDGVVQREERAACRAARS